MARVAVHGRAGRARRRRPRTPGRLGPSAAALALGALSATALSVAALSGSPPADAAPAHVWNGLGLRAGTVCTDGATTSPLASWDLGTGATPGYLVQPVSATAGVASAVPPLASLGPQSSVPITSASGSVGQLDPGQIPALAALLERFGPSSDDTTAAALAHLVMTAVSGSSASLPDCEDAGREAQLSGAADGLAGPYSLAFAAHPTPSLPGRSDSVAVTVTGASGGTVAGATVTLRTSRPVFDGSTSTQATTDSSGTATARFTVPAGTTVSGLTFTASATVATSLTAVSIQATPSATDPTGASVSALVPAGDSTAQATTAVQVDRSSHPRLTLTADPAATLRGASITPTLAVTGLNGHAASGTVTTLGPLALTDRTLCSSRSASDFAGARIAARSRPVELTGDGVVRAAPWTAAAAGCYLSTARVTTTDAVPAATASASTPRAITVLDTAVTARLTTPLVGRDGSSDVTLQLQRTHATAFSVRTVRTGPVVPGQSAQGCGSVDYDGAPSTTTESTPPAVAAPSTRSDPSASPRSPTAGATRTSALPAGASERTVTVQSPGLGCTRVRVALVLHTGAEDLVVAVPAEGPADLLTIAPQVQVTTDRAYGQTGSAVTVRASVSGTFQQAGQVSVHLERTANSEFGCRGAVFTHPTRTAEGAAVPVTEVYKPVAVHSPVLADTGCYRPVAELRMDANATITAAGTAGPDAVIAVGLNPSAAASVKVGAHGPDGTSSTPIIVAVLAFLALVLLAILVILRLARDPGPEAGAPLRLTAPPPS